MVRVKITSFSVKPNDGRFVYQGKVTVDETPVATWLTGDECGVTCFEEGDVVVKATLRQRAVVELTDFVRGRAGYTRVCPCMEVPCLAVRVVVSGKEVAILFIEVEREPVSCGHFIPPADDFVPMVAAPQTNVSVSDTHGHRRN